MSKTVEIQIEKSRGEGRNGLCEGGLRWEEKDSEGLLPARTLDGLRRARQALTHFCKKRNKGVVTIAAPLIEYIQKRIYDKEKNSFFWMHYCE